MPVLAQQAQSMTPEEQLDDLRRRFALLEGERKANNETAKMNIQQNREIIAQLKEENKSLMEQVTKIREEKPQTVEQQLERVMTEVQALQRKYDTLKSANEKKREHIDSLDSKMNELHVGAKLYSSEADPEMRQIRVLENRLDKAMIKHNEAQSIKKTYEQIVKRLKEERIGFDNSLAAIERALKAKERDYEELLLLSHDAYHAKEMAQAELHRFEQGVMEERNQRDQEVQEKKALVEQRVAMNKKLEEHQKRLKQQQEAEKQAQGATRDATVTSDLTAGISSDYAQEERQKLEDYQEAFHAIKEATGVDDVNEVIQKFLTQEDTHKNLEELTKQNQKIIEDLTKERAKVRLQVEELKFCGTANRRQAIDELEDRLAKASEKFERNRAKYERVAKMLIDMKAGIDHISEKLVGIKLENESALEVNDETVEEVLQQCELKVYKLYSLTQAAEDDMGDKKRLDDEQRYEEKLMLRSQADPRIKLTDKDDDGDDDDDAFEEEMDEDVPHRRQVKHRSGDILEKQQTKLRKKGKKKGDI